MSHQALSAVVAIAGGLVLAVLLFVPVAAVMYRRNGSLTGGDLATLVATTVYGLALWTYTLLPLPIDLDYRCRRPITDVRSLWDGILAHPHATALDLARNPMVLQLVLNVALFVPLGVLLRVKARRGVFVAAVAGLGVSLMIETTQYTGIWGLYPCAYRYFDVGDLITNPTGAVVGSVMAALVVGREPERRARALPRLTPGRRLVALVSDLLVIGLLGTVTVVVWRVWSMIDPGVPTGPDDAHTQALLQWGLPLAVQAIAVLGWGCTIGEAVVQIRTRPRRRRWTLTGRIMKLATGVGALCVLAAGIIPASGWILTALLVAHLAAVAIPGGRGLSNTLARLDVELMETSG